MWKTFFSTLVVIGIVVSLDTTTARAQKDEGDSALTQAIEISAATGRPIFAVAGRST